MSKWEEIYLQRINPRDFDVREVSEEEILKWFDLCDAAWIHDGDPKSHILN